MNSEFQMLDILKAKTENVYVCNEETGEKVEMPAYKANNLNKDSYYIVINITDDYTTVVEVNKEGQSKHKLFNVMNLYADREFDLVGHLKFELNI